MVHNALSTIRDHGLFASGDTVVVAVSGGADSVALLDFLASSVQMRLTLVVAHVNHCLRGADADGDEGFVVDLAHRYGLPCEVRREDVYGLARDRRLSLEDAGRTARYAFFDEVAARYGAGTIALAHHADDQAETVLMRLVRGAGGSGLSAMAPRSGNGRYVRPLLHVSRAEIEEYLRGRGLAYRHDASNDDTRFLRNRIRHELLPLLESYNGEVRQLLATTATVLAADEAVLDRVTGDAFVRHGALRGDCTVLSVPGVRGELPGVRMRLYRQALRHTNRGLAGIGYRHLAAVDELLCSGAPNAQLHLPGGCRVVRCYEELLFQAGPHAVAAPFHLEIPGPGRYELSPGACLVVRYADVLQRDDPAAEEGRRAVFDGDAAPFPWLVRSFLPGDRLQPAGMAGSKKAKELFMERKVPRSQRPGIPLLFQEGTLLWVCGLRRSRHAPVDTGTIRPVEVEFLGNMP